MAQYGLMEQISADKAKIIWTDIKKITGIPFKNFSVATYEKRGKIVDDKNGVEFSITEDGILALRAYTRFAASIEAQVIRRLNKDFGVVDESQGSIFARYFGKTRSELVAMDKVEISDDILPLPSLIDINKIIDKSTKTSLKSLSATRFAILKILNSRKAKIFGNPTFKKLKTYSNSGNKYHLTEYNGNYFVDDGISHYYVEQPSDDKLQAVGLLSALESVIIRELEIAAWKEEPIKSSEEEAMDQLPDDLKKYYQK